MRRQKRSRKIINLRKNILVTTSDNSKIKISVYYISKDQNEGKRWYRKCKS